jgi:purine-nucleoside/S-methyl-5'-thioadenosine phosphorylase / adenosine deaminase
VSRGPDGVLRARTLEATGVVRAAFTTRQGGVSAGPYRSLNLSYAVGDSRPAVARNRRLAAAAVGADPRRLVEAQQVHGAAAAVVGPDEAGRTVPGVDALLTGSPGVWLAVHTADCVPVLIVDPGRPAIAAVHAGWRGVAAGAVPAALAHLEGAFQCDLARCLVAVGPAIGGCCYEVDRPVADAMRAAPWWPQVSQRGAPGKWYLDLRQAIRAQLNASGVPADHIDVTPGCTRCQPDLYFSYRRERATGRMAACIRLCERAQRE